jgi:hypothetical protein
MGDTSGKGKAHGGGDGSGRGGGYGDSCGLAEGYGGYGHGCGLAEGHGGYGQGYGGGYGGGETDLYNYQPKTELGKKLIAIKKSYIENGGVLLNDDDFDERFKR